MTDYKKWCTALFAAIDSKDSRDFTRFLTSDARFRFGCGPPVVGTDAIIQTLDTFFASITALSHHISDVWEVPDHLICRGDVCYTRLDGRSVTIPFCDIFSMRSDKVAHYDIYLDPTPLLAAQ